jgi:hypothetical protein
MKSKAKVIPMNGFHFMKRNRRWIILEMDSKESFPTFGKALSYVLMGLTGRPHKA